MDIPTKPQGNSNEARFMRWVWDMLAGSGKMIDGPNAILCKTTKGRFYLFKQQPPPAPSGTLNYRGEFDKTQPYKVGDIVRVSTIPIYPNPLDVANQVAGWFICVQDTVVFNTQKGYYSIPQYPEPVTSAGDNSAATTGTCYWHMWNLGVQVIVVADDIAGSKLQMFNASPSFTALPRTS